MSKQPRLDTIRMVERAIKDSPDYPTRTSLWRSLPKQMMYSTFKRILEFLEESGKIFFDGRDVVWAAADNAKLRKLVKESVKL